MDLYHVSHAWRQSILKLILKSPRFVSFGANLTYFGVKPNIPTDLTDCIIARFIDSAPLPDATVSWKVKKTKLSLFQPIQFV